MPCAVVKESTKPRGAQNKPWSMGSRTAQARLSRRREMDRANAQSATGLHAYGVQVVSSKEQAGRSGSAGSGVVF